MKLDFGGLGSTAPPFVGSSSSSEFLDGFSATPSFELPPSIIDKEAIQMVKPAKGTPHLHLYSKRVLWLLLILELAWAAISCRLHELANKRRISVTGASKLLANILYSFRGMGLSVGTMIAGWDEMGPGLYYVYSEGGRLKGTQFSVGSGSPYAYGVLDNGYCYDMSIEEAAELARRSIYHATFRDGASGGVASVYYVGPSGWKKLSGDDVGELHYKYYPVMPSTVEQEMVEVVGA